MDLLEIAVSVDESGPVISLSGEADLTSAPRLRQALADQIAADPGVLTVDAAGLRFADSATIRELIAAHHAIRERGGSLVLARPQRSVAEALTLLGVDQVLAVRTGTCPDAGYRSGEGERAGST